VHIKDTFPWKSDDERPVKICIYLAGILDGSADPKGLAGGEGRGVPSPPPHKRIHFSLEMACFGEFGAYFCPCLRLAL